MRTITATPARSARAIDGHGQGRRWKALVVAASAWALTLMLLPAGVASAEPDHTATLNRANPTFTWEGSGSGVSGQSGSPLHCTDAPFTCEYILLDVEKAGVLALTLDITHAVSDPTGEICDGTLDLPYCEYVADIDGYVYKSNAAGEPLGDALTPAGSQGCATLAAIETCKVAVEPGWYVIEVEYYLAVDAHYHGTAELGAAPPGPPAEEPQVISLDGCNFTLYYFKDSAERLQALVPPGYHVRPYASYPLDSPLVDTEGSATIAAAAYDCDRIEVPGSSPAPAIFTVLSVLVHPPDDETAIEGPAQSDYYVLWVHADNPQLVELLESRDMPAYLVPEMVFEKPLQSLGVRVEVPWSHGAYELATTGFQQDPFHDHDNSYWHDSDDQGCDGNGAGPRQQGCVTRMDFVASGARDQHCAHQADHHAIECGRLTAEADTPVASFFGAADRTADTAWDHDPLEQSWFELH
jgi:hypothetical protein